MFNILLVEDDTDLNLIVKNHLLACGYQVCATFNGKEALKKFEQQEFDLIISDIMMPLCDGYELAFNVRKENSDIPIIFMSAKDDKPSKKIGYKIGIDDYITKPFDIEELELKIAVYARRKAKSGILNELVVGNFKMNKEEHIALIDNEEISLTVREFDILFSMLSNPKKTYTRGRLMEEFWGFDSSATSRTVDVYMAKLRDKTKTCDGFEILTVHGLGYKVVKK